MMIDIRIEVPSDEQLLFYTSYGIWIAFPSEPKENDDWRNYWRWMIKTDK